MRKLLAGGVITGTVIALSLFWGTDAKAASRIASNVSIGTVDVSGMTSSEASDAISSYASETGQKQITLKTADKSVTVSAADLGFAADSGESVDTALNYGHKGNLLERYSQQKDIASGKKKCLNLQTTADAEKIRSFLEKNEDKLVTEPVDGTLKREDGEFTYVAGKEGHALDIDKSVVAVMNFVADGGIDSTDTVDIVTTTKKPKGSEEELSQIKDALGTFSTDFSSSSAARAQNVRNGASKINGTVLYPGDKYSVAHALNPMTKENGYAPAPSYENGTTVETYGGGICQVSTTLYNAVIRAELKVLNRSAHSMMVHYVEPSDDAAIAGFSKDFEFQNNQKTPVYIEGVTNGGTITFTVYGKETRDPDRTLEFVSEKVGTIEHKTTFKADSSLPVGTVTLSSTATPRDGLKAHLLKIVKINGKEQSRTVFNNSVYRATDAVYTVGTKSESAEARAAMSSAIASGNLSTVRSAAAKWRNAAADKPEKKKAGETEEDKHDDKKEEKKDESSKDDKTKAGQDSGKNSAKVSDKTSEDKKN